MTRHERDECMRYVGQLEGLLAVIVPVEGDYEEDSTIIFNKIKDIANDLECLVKGYDKPMPIRDISATCVTSSEPIEGGDDDDV